MLVSTGGDAPGFLPFCLAQASCHMVAGPPLTELEIFNEGQRLEGKG